MRSTHLPGPVLGRGDTGNCWCLFPEAGTAVASSWNRKKFDEHEEEG